MAINTDSTMRQFDEIMKRIEYIQKTKPFFFTLSMKKGLAVIKTLKTGVDF